MQAQVADGIIVVGAGERQPRSDAGALLALMTQLAQRIPVLIIGGMAGLDRPAAPGPGWHQAAGLLPIAAGLWSLTPLFAPGRTGTDALLALQVRLARWQTGMARPLVWAAQPLAPALARRLSPMPPIAYAPTLGDTFSLTFGGQRLAAHVTQHTLLAALAEAGILLARQSRSLADLSFNPLRLDRPQAM